MGFAWDYGRQDPMEDFATSFAAYFMGQDYPAASGEDHGDASVLADSPIARRLDPFSLDPAAERFAVEDAGAITDDVLWRTIRATNCPP